ncbi:dystrophin, isoforms A/C/F/G/H-like [Ochlerotatus camptorhynchus]|uniref:dystrophin, isoforms A/C/F/G/H-like n=1 Tax=Ochlerotatus camptorhynchus TaxID=644619 RepID=UPI0031D17B81
MLMDAAKKENRPTDLQMNQQVIVQQQPLKAPISTFDGQYENWPKFEAMFLDIKAKSNDTNSIKLYRLDEALVERFGNPRVIINTHIRGLLSLKKMTKESYLQQSIVAYAFVVVWNQFCEDALKEITPNEKEDHAEFVVLSDTVRHRRAKTLNLSPTNKESKAKEISVRNLEQQSNILPDILPATFRLVETSALFSCISSAEPLQQAKSETRTVSHHYSECSVVEVKEKNMSAKMSVRSINMPSSDVTMHGQVVDTINILESCKFVEPEYVETVHIIDASSDTDTSCPSPKPDKKQMNVSKPLTRITTSTPKSSKPINTVQIGGEQSQSPKQLRISKKLILPQKSSIDVLRDFDKICLNVEEASKNHPGLRDLVFDERDSFYSSDKENYDELLVFSEDEDIPRYSIEMATDSDSDTSRIETPHASNLGEKSIKVISPSDQTPFSPIGNYRYDSYKKLTSLEQRVNEFDKTAKYMIKKLEQTRDKIDNCDDGPSVVENLKLTIAPDAATLISQGDTLILETHGKSNLLTQRLMDTQARLRDRFKEVQNSRNFKCFNNDIRLQMSLNDSDSSTNEFSHLKAIDLEEISSKVLKRIGDLLAKPLTKDNEVELTKRVLDIKERQEEVKLAIGVASQTTPSKKVSDTMTNLEMVSENPI